ncbi:hypothetical protein SDC9_73136 [bioreactor metagenome]|uniref:Uncharacterized protein n=1 Tax=bioreactor metagenome TaxID=1076179 RepID=A0A644YDB4_9ZZZZ
MFVKDKKIGLWFLNLIVELKLHKRILAKIIEAIAFGRFKCQWEMLFHYKLLVIPSGQTV